MARGDFPRRRCKVTLQKQGPINLWIRRRDSEAPATGVDWIKMVRKRKTLMSQERYDNTSGNTNAPTQALARHATAMLVEDLKRT